MRAKYALALSLFILSAIPAVALPGEAAAVIAHCGQPKGEDEAISQVTDHTQRDLIYNDLILHFEPMGTGWSFTTAWHGHLPMTRTELETRLPCFREAMQEVAAAPAAAIDPTTAQQVAAPTVDNTTFGIPHLWFIVALVVALLIFAILPSRKQPIGPVATEPKRFIRKPRIFATIARRRGRVTDLEKPPVL